MGADPFAAHGRSHAPIRRATLDPRDIEEIRQRHALSDIIGRHTKLRRAGREFVGLCPFHPEKSPSFHVNDAKGLYHCFGCGAHGDSIRFLRELEGMSFIEAVQQLAGSDLPVISDEDRIKAAREDAAERARAIADAKAFAGRCVDPVGTLAEVYARSRGITATLPPSIRFGMLPGWRNRETGEWAKDRPAMVGLCVDGSGDLVAIQRIFLRPDGAGKAQMRKPKLTLGRVRGAALRLGPVASEIIITEGPEDGLSLMQQLPGSSVWVALGTALMPEIEMPPEVRTVVIAGQNDAAGRAAVTRAAEALTLRGLSVKAVFPSPEYRDWNDELRGCRI
ncbi:MAG: toprim domain-containing protein [Rhizorhabdus sp.]|nr:toprim domain-containing protein [Rhizorhabdus sp.]